MLTVEREWFRETPEAVLEHLSSSPQGLSEDEAERRIAEYGKNELEEIARNGPIRMFLQQFANPMVVILLFAIVLSAIIANLHGSHEREGYIDAIVIAGIVFVNAIVGFLQEYKSEKALEALRDLSAPKAVARRNGSWREIEATDLVPGDIIALEAGDIVPADGRILNQIALASDESALTGESLAVQKSNLVIDYESPAIGDMSNLVFQGSTITTGKGTAVITSTGMNTEFGKIAKMVQESKEDLTPLQLDLRDLGMRLGGIVLGISIIVSLALVFVNTTYDWNEALFVGIAIAVAAIPEGLPAIVTVTLAIGVKRMVSRHAIVKRLPSVEALGSTTVICSDKTGTITKNEMTTRYLHLISETYIVTGQGYSKEGEIHRTMGPLHCSEPPQILDSVSVNEKPDLAMLLKASQLCSTASIFSSSDDDPNWTVVGDPTEAALLIAAEKAGIPREDTNSSFNEVTEFSFDSIRRRMTTVQRDNDGRLWAFSKGAPEVILERATKVLLSGQEIEMNQDHVRNFQETNSLLASCAMRVLALAYRRLDGEMDWDAEVVEQDLVFVGLVGMLDPPRDGVTDSIAKTKQAGIRSMMITGDHVLTASAVARSVGLTHHQSDGVTGTEIGKMSDDELDEVVRDRDVFARVSPEHKLRIVQALKRQNQVVAMTGDGVNDASAIKTADVGIAMGIRGAGVTKEASDLILADDNFSTIVSAVEVGREIYANIRKFVAFLLSANAGEVLIVFIMVMAGLPIPLTPIMILWINLVTDGPPAIALGFDPPPNDIMSRPPRKFGERILNGQMSKTILIGGILATLASGTVYLYALYSRFGFIPQITGPYVDWGLPQNAEILTLAQSATFVSMVLFQLFWVWSVRDEYKPAWRTRIRESRELLAAVLLSFILTLLVIVSPLSSIFGTVPLSVDLWILVIGVSITGFLVPVHRLAGGTKKD